MKTLLEDGALEIDNNGSERAINPFVIEGKNWQKCKIKCLDI